MTATTTTSVWVVIPAAGIGQRMATDQPKQYLSLLGKTVIEHTLAVFLNRQDVAGVVVALHPNDTLWAALPVATHPKIHTTHGGADRRQSVLNALHYLETKICAEQWLWVHDAVRPCVPQSDLDRLKAELHAHPVGGLLATPVNNTLKRSDAAQQVRATVDRAELWQALTPQMFRYGDLLRALQASLATQYNVTDDASAIEWMGLKPLLVHGHSCNVKLTYAEDLLWAKWYLSQESAPCE